jgi:hypothetical protein
MSSRRMLLGSAAALGPMKCPPCGTLRVAAMVFAPRVLSPRCRWHIPRATGPWREGPPEAGWSE